VAWSTPLALHAGVVDQDSFRRIIGLLAGLGLPIHSALVKPAAMRQAMLDATLHRNGSVNLVIPASIGSASFVASHDAVTDDMLIAASEMLHNFSELGRA